jgi:YVTN family beta-propeller protein
MASMTRTSSCLRFVSIFAVVFAVLTTATAALAQSRAYVLDAADLVVIDTGTGNTITRMPLGSQAGFNGIAFKVDGTIGYVTDGVQVLVIDPVTNTIASRFAAGTNPGRLALTPDGARLFVSNTTSNTITVVNTATRTVIATISLPAEASEMAMAPNGARLYVLAHFSFASVYAIDVATMTVIATIPTEASPQHLEVHPDSSKLYLTHVQIQLTSLPTIPWVTAIDTQTFLSVGRVDLPIIASVSVQNQIDRPVLLPDGSRMLVPHWVKGFRTSPTAIVDIERVHVIDPATMTLVTTMTTPRPSISAEGRVVATAPATGPAFVIGVWSSSLFDASTNTLRDIGNGVSGAKAAAVLPLPACAFVIFNRDRYVKTIADTVTIDVPAPAGCAWSASMTSDWLTITSASSGVGPGTITVAPTALGEPPKRSLLSVGGQEISIQRVIGGVIIDSLAEGTSVTPPLTINGWAAERTVLQRNGTPTIGLQDGSTALPAPQRIGRPDISALYGSAYFSSGFRLGLSRVAVGPHAFRANATSTRDGSVMTTVVNVTVVRNPTVRLDLASGAQVTQPFPISGWAVDGTAPSGVGFDAVQIWAYPTNGAAPRLVGNAQYGIGRFEAGSIFMGDPQFNAAGFELMAGGLPAGSYVIRALAHSTVTGLYDAMAEVQVTVLGGPQSPFGSFDAPAQGASNLSGSISVTGWALDDGGVDRVDIWRDLVPGETTPPFTGGGLGQGKVFIASAPFVSGARPDIEAAYPTWPNANRSGWGYLLLTYGLWNQGNGTYTLHAFAYDHDGNGTVLGSKSITVNNATATRPFGSIDTPGLGQTLSGGVWNFGWALTPNATPSCTIPPNGVRVSIDSGPLVPVSYGDMRADIAAAFPGYTNTNGAGGAYYLDTTTLTNGVHTIGWYVEDSCGRAEGIGSRFFSVQNGSTTTMSADRISSARARVVSDRMVVRIRPGERAEVQLPAAVGTTYTGSQIVNGSRRALPIGSSIDPASNTFYWQPVAGFLGAHDLEFVSSLGDVVFVRAIVGTSVQAAIDTPRSSVSSSFTVAGWAIDEGATSGTGIDTVHVWAYPATGGNPIFLGVADYGAPRADIAALFGDQFSGAAYTLAAGGLTPGLYDVVVYPHSAVAADFHGAQVVRVTVK